jgi:hypothetical protein
MMCLWLLARLLCGGLLVCLVLIFLLFKHDFIMARSIGVTEFLARKFDVFDFEDKWLDSFGLPERNSKWIVYGHSGNGKTEFCMQLARYFCNFGKVYYNSFEQGISKSLQDCVQRNDFVPVKGKIVFGDKDSFDAMLVKLGERNSARVVFIDSRDYLNLTAEQFRTLTKRFPRKSFVIICWESGGKPKGEYAKSIEFMCDVKIRVDRFVAYPRSRFGGCAEYVVWENAPSLPQVNKVRVVESGTLKLF